MLIDFKTGSHTDLQSAGIQNLPDGFSQAGGRRSSFELL
jgi:hypothetical protein